MCRKLLLALILIGVPPALLAQDAPSWQVVKGKHFLVHHVGNRELAERALAAAEKARREIASGLGLRKHGDFWLWEDRIAIYIHRNKREHHVAP